MTENFTQIFQLKLKRLYSPIFVLQVEHEEVEADVDKFFQIKIFTSSVQIHNISDTNTFLEVTVASLVIFLMNLKIF